MAVHRALAGAAVVALLSSVAGAVTLQGGGSKKTDCRVEMMTEGLAFPSGSAQPYGATCADGDVCDKDGQRNGACLFTPILCLNVADGTLPKCGSAQVSSVKVKGKRTTKGQKSKLEVGNADGLVQPSSTPECGNPFELSVGIGGPNKKGELLPGSVELRVTAKSTNGTDKDTFKLVCLPATSVSTPTTSTTSSTTTTTTSSPPIDTTTTTTTPGATTTTTTTVPAVLPPTGAGLHATIIGAEIPADRRPVVRLTLTDDGGRPITPQTTATSDPDHARVRITLAYIEVGPDTLDDEATFTKYVNYITNHVTGPIGSTDQPTYDTTGTYTLIDFDTGTWTYRFGRTLPSDYPASSTHTVGAQVERTFDGAREIANPLYDFVPAGGAVTTVRQVATTAECNTCHNPLAVHGGGRREVGLCQLCHTDQAMDPDTGHTIDLKHMIHRLHMGKELPSIMGGSVGDKYGFVGFQNQETVFAENVKVCVKGPKESAPCETDDDCGGSGGTCTGTSTVGVAFPKDIRNCTACHADGVGATASNYRLLPSTLSCTGCHDDVNPSESDTDVGAPGTNHPTGGARPDTMCHLCHQETMLDEFDISVPGAHVLPTRSATLTGLNAEIQSASGSASGGVTFAFTLTDGDGNAITSLSGPPSISVSTAISGPSTDFGAYQADPVITENVSGGGLSGPVNGVFTYTTTQTLPPSASGTWRVGLQAQRTFTIHGTSVREVAQNPVKDFSVDGSSLVIRRTVVAEDSCSTCHGTFGKDFLVHGGGRTQVEYCVICHNPNVTDFDRRKNAITRGADAVTEPIDLKHLVHKLHRGEALEQQPYIVYGFGSAPLSYAAHDFGDIRFPGNLADCQTCHAGDSYLLPLPSGVLATVQSDVTGSGGSATETVTGGVPPIRDACLSCHDSADAAAHAELNTTASGVEACGACHGEGAAFAVSVVHANAGAE